MLRHEIIDDIPLYFSYRGDATEAASRGVVLFYHGFTVGASINEKELDDLAANGFLAVGVDAVGHGARRYPDWGRRFPTPEARNEAGELQEHWEQSFRTVVRESADEIPRIIRSLADIHGFRGPVGVCGISMGGMIAYEALLRSAHIEAVATIVSYPRTITAASDLAKMAPRAILTQTGGLDEVVSSADAEQFHQRLALHYRDYPERNTHINYPHSPHSMRPQDWATAWRRTLDWFLRFL